jgi:hypothetical protein
MLEVYVNRRTFVIKRGRMREAIELFTSWAAERDRPTKVYGNNGVAPVTFDTITFDTEFASLAEYEAYWTGMLQSQEQEEVQRKLDEITVPGGKNEILARLYPA